MGSNCSSYQDPAPQNWCEKGINDTYEVNGFCTIDGPSGNSHRASVCEASSSTGEWVLNGSGSSCNYNDCNYTQAGSAGCCNGCCGIVGSGASCVRIKYTAMSTDEALRCCMNDYNCTGQGCFTNNGNNTCPSNGEPGWPNYRNLVSSDCQNVFMQYCTGQLPSDNPESTAWLSRWTSNDEHSCTYILARNLFGYIDPNIPSSKNTTACNPPPVITPGICSLPIAGSINSEGYFWAQRLVEAALARYESQGFKIGTLPGFPGYNPFQDFLYTNVCCPYPGLCQSGLQKICAVHSAQRLSLNPLLTKWCGCHLNPAEYETYSAKYNIPPQCTPTCNRVGNIPIVGINATPIQCTQNICLIDNVSVNLINTQIGGDIQFNQICGNCTGVTGSISTCSCIVDGVTLDIANSTIGGSVVPVSQGCGNVTCTQKNPGTTGPTYITVPCGTSDDPSKQNNPYSEYDEKNEKLQLEAKKQSTIWTLIIIGGILLLICLIVFLFYPGIPISKQTNITKKLQQEEKGFIDPARSILNRDYPQFADTINKEPESSNPRTFQSIENPRFTNTINKDPETSKQRTFQSIENRELTLI